MSTHHVQIQAGRDAAGRDINKVTNKPPNTAFKVFLVVLGIGSAALLDHVCERNFDGELCNWRLWRKKKVRDLTSSDSCALLRNNHLEKIHTLFTQSNQRQPVVAIVGDPASGKTELAHQYAHKYKDDYYHQWIVSGENLNDGYKALAQMWIWNVWIWNVLNKTLPFQDSEIVRSVHEIFSYSRRKKSLIIFDNVPPNFVGTYLAGTLPDNTHILCTSRIARTTGWTDKLDLTSDIRYQLTEGEGIEILERRVQTSDFDRQAAIDIVRKFKHCPVVIAQAGNYICTNRIHMRDYLSTYNQSKINVLTQGALVSRGAQNINIVDAIKKKVNEVKAINPEAYGLVCFFACVTRQELLRSDLSKFLGSDPIKFNEHLTFLEPLILLTTTSVSMHEVFQEILIEIIPPADKAPILSRLGSPSNPFR